MAKKHTVSETNETISAVITALGEGAVGIIRISGTEAAAIGDKLFRSASGKKLTEHTPHLLVYGHVVDEENSKIDEVLAVYMQGTTFLYCRRCSGNTKSWRFTIVKNYPGSNL